MLEALDLHSLADEQTRERVRQLLNLLEDVRADLRAAQAEHQRLRDAINRLKGEQGTPTIKASKPQQPRQAHASAQERRTPQGWSKGCKTACIPLDRAQVVTVDPTVLPPDAECKGYEEVVVQDILFRTDNVLCHKEPFYSPSPHRLYLAALPPGSSGQLGPGLKSLALALYCGAQMSEPQGAELLRSVGGQSSAGQGAHLLRKAPPVFHAEHEALSRAGLASSPWQHLDETSTRVNGQNGYCHIGWNPL
jgi:cell division septum initiation protein DivIVA